MLKYLCVLLTLFLSSCATRTFQPMTPGQRSLLQQGQRYFLEGYYKRAMHELLPLACDGIANAEYAVGYMYYYGYGVVQDTEVGHIWVKRAADQQYPPAQHALALINIQGAP